MYRSKHIPTQELGAEEIDRLFNLVELKLNWPEDTLRRERWIFEQVFGKSPQTLDKMWLFLKNVKNCPPEVLAFCQELLQPQNTSRIAE